MRTFLFLILLALAHDIFCQKHIRFLIKDPCNDTLSCPGECEVIDNEGNSLKVNDKGYFILDLKATYFVSIFYHRKKLYNIINFSYKANDICKTDSVFLIPKINPFTENIMYDSFKYYSCSELCNGFCIDFYPNGVKRLEGFFVQGLPIGKLILYAPEGNILKIEKYDKHGVLIRW